MDPRLQKILNLSLPARLAILFGCVLTIGVVFYFAIYQFQLEERDLLQAQHATLQTQLREKQEIAGNLEAYRLEYERLEALLTASLQELPQKKEIPSLLTSIAEAAKGQGLNILLFRPKPEVIRDFYAEVPVEMKLLGSYHDIALFYEEVGRMSRIVNIDDVKLQRKGVIGQTSSLEVNCQVTTFRFLDASELPKAGTAPGKGAGR